MLVGATTAVHVAAMSRVVEWQSVPSRACARQVQSADARGMLGGRRPPNISERNRLQGGTRGWA